MSKPAIVVENLGKQYKIGLREKADRTFREAIVDTLAAPLRRLRTLGEKSVGDDTIWALRDVSFEVHPGEVVGIIGRNGAGKTTLLKILSRITEPTEGQVRLRGRVASLLEVGTGFHRELTGRENIYLNGAILGMKKAEIDRRFDEIVDFAGVEKFIDTPIKRYSSGMYVRLAFGVAAHLEPEILMVDEVLAVGDVQFQKKCLGKMHEVSVQQGRTVLFVSHNMGAVHALCPRSLLLSSGSIAADGATNAVVEDYLSSFEEEAASGLPDISKRPGAGRLRITQIQMLFGETGGSTIMRSGRPARFVFHFSRPVPGCRLVFALYDHHGHLVSDFDTRLRAPQDRWEPRLGNALECAVDELCLVPGRYRMNVWLEASGELQEHIEAATFLDVREGTLRGRPLPSGLRGTTAIPHRWAFPLL